MKVELIYLADESTIFHKHMEVSPSTTARDLIIESQVLNAHPELDLERLKCGVFSKQIQLDYEMQLGDRLEIYRPLTISPMEKRRLLAQNKKNN